MMRPLLNLPGGAAVTQLPQPSPVNTGPCRLNVSPAEGELIQPPSR